MLSSFIKKKKDNIEAIVISSDSEQGEEKESHQWTFKPFQPGVKK